MRPIQFIPTLCVLLTAQLALAPSAIAQVEWRLGIAEHDIEGKESGLNIQPQIVFDDIERLSRFGEFRPYLTASINTDGQLAFGGVGLMAVAQFRENWFFEYQFGLVTHDGRVTLPPPDQSVYRRRILDTERTLGCDLLFHNAPAIGRRITDTVSISIYFEHLSHGNMLCNTGKNEGLDNIGVRIGKRF